MKRAPQQMAAQSEAVAQSSWRLPRDPLAGRAATPSDSGKNDMEKHPLEHLLDPESSLNRKEQQRLDSQLATFARHGVFNTLSELLAQGANAKASDSEALSVAAANGHADCVEFLIPLSTPTARFSQALIGAASRGHADCVRLLIPVSNPKARSSAALAAASKNGFAACVELLLPVSDPLAREGEALRAAILHNRIECAALLVPSSNAKDRRSWALRLAIQSRRVECAKLLIPASRDLSEDPLPAHMALGLGLCDIFAPMLAFNPRLAGAISLSEALGAAEAADHSELALFLRAAIESRSISEACLGAPAHLPPKVRL